MCPSFIIHDVGADTSFVCTLVVAERILVASVTGTQHDKLRIAVDQLRDDRVDQIKTFLIRQTGNESDHKLGFIDFQSEFFLKGFLIGFLLLNNIRLAVRSSQFFVLTAVPHIYVDTIDDSAKFAAVIPQMCIQSFPIEWCLNFFGIRSADGRNHVRIGKTTLEHVRVFIALLERILVEYIIREARPVTDRRNIVDALEAQIMDRDYCLCAGYRRSLKQCMQIHRYKASLPVMAMDDIRDPVHIVEGCKCRFCEEAVFGNIIDQVDVGIAGTEEFFVVDEIIYHTVPDIFHDSHIERTSISTQVHHEITTIDHLFLILPGNAFVTRQNHLDVTVLLDQCFGKRIHDIAQTAGFNKRITF